MSMYWQVLYLLHSHEPSIAITWPMMLLWTIVTSVLCPLLNILSAVFIVKSPTFPSIIYFFVLSNA